MRLLGGVAHVAAVIEEDLLDRETGGKTVILMMDQSKISDGFECLMVSLRVGERAIPVSWKVIKTSGAIGFDIQEKLLNDVVQMVPDGIAILLAADRFYGTSLLINWCKKQGWQYRILNDALTLQPIPYLWEFKNCVGW